MKVLRVLRVWKVDGVWWVVGGGFSGGWMVEGVGWIGEGGERGGRGGGLCVDSVEGCMWTVWTV